jgi:predicted DNA-binding WGR domain protein
MRRSLVFAEGSSDKFWTIALDGTSHTVTFGRAGTAGQTKTKDFASVAQARTAFHKLVAAKIAKGYTPASDDADEGAAQAAPALRLVRDPAPVPVPAPAAPPAPVPGRPAIDLSEAEWAAAAWRKIELPLDGPAPFDRTACFKRLAKIKTSTYGYIWEIRNRGPKAPISRAEAHFWLRAAGVGQVKLAHPPWETRLRPDAVARMLATEPFDGDMHFDDVAVHAARSKLAGPDLALVVSSLVPPAELTASLLRTLGTAPDPEHSEHGMWRRMAEGAARYIVPRLTDADAELIRAELRRHLARTDPQDGVDLAMRYAGAFGLDDELLALLRTVPDGRYAEDDSMHAGSAREVIFGLNDPAAVDIELRRLVGGLGLSAGDVATWLAHTGTSGLDLVRDAVLATRDNDDAEELAVELARVRAPEAAPFMLELILAGKAPKIARAWLAEHQAAVVVGLAPVAGRPGKLGEAATEQLRRLVRGGHAAEVAALLGHVDEDVATRVRALVLETDEALRPTVDLDAAPGWLRTALPAGRARPPAWLDTGVLPRLPIGDAVAGPDVTAAIVGSLVRSVLDARYPVVTALKEHVDQAALDQFAWTLFEEWLAAGAPSKDRWAMHGLGLLGGDAVVMRLTPLVRTWPGESQHARAVIGLECLRAIGTDTALMQINGIAEKLRYQALKAKARQMLEQIARDRGLTRAELEDRIVPDCGLDDRGRREFDFGPRRFTFALGPDLKPLVRDEAGKLRTDLPKPGARDDAALAEPAVAEWKLIRKQVRDVARIQAGRLEQAMVAGRRWSPDEHRRLLVGHPLMIHLVRSLIWGAWDDGRLVATFRVTDEQDLADAQDGPVTLDPAWRVGIVHPLSLDADVAAAWGEILSDYELIPPFPQLGRPVHGLEPDEVEATALTRFNEVTVPASSLVSTLERLGWTRGFPEDAGVFYDHSKHFPAAGVTAVVTYPGVPMGMIVDWEDQRIEHCVVVPDDRARSGYWHRPEGIPLGRVDPIVISEVLADLHVIAGKAR